MAEVEEETEAKPGIKDAIMEVLDELGITGGSSSSGNETETSGDAETKEAELASPRKIELDTERSITEAVKGLTINVNTSKEKEPESKPEPEEQPGGKSWLTKFVGLGS